MNGKTNRYNSNSFFNKFLNMVEVVGNKLPHPVAMFFGFFIITIILSFILSKLGVSVTYSEVSKATGEITEKTTNIINLLTRSGIRGIFSTAVKNFTGHAALGSIVVAMLGIGLANETGLLSALIKKMVLSTPKSMISICVVFAGVMSNIASDAGYVVLIPLGAVIFASFGRHPLAGLAAAFAGVSGGFSANLLIGNNRPAAWRNKHFGCTDSFTRILCSSYSKLFLYGCFYNINYNNRCLGN